MFSVITAHICYRKVLLPHYTVGHTAHFIIKWPSRTNNKGGDIILYWWRLQESIITHRKSSCQPISYRYNSKWFVGQSVNFIDTCIQELTFHLSKWWLCWIIEIYAATLRVVLSAYFTLHATICGCTRKRGDFYQMHATRLKLGILGGSSLDVIAIRECFRGLGHY